MLISTVTICDNETALTVHTQACKIAHAIACKLLF